MTRIPVDSAEAAELREAAAARPEAPESVHDDRCRNGWLGEDLDGRLVPCLVCRPHLTTWHGNVVHTGTIARRRLDEEET